MVRPAEEIGATFVHHANPLPPHLRISVVIPTHNRPAFLAEALASVMAQTMPPFEVIVVENGSTPSTQAELQKLVVQYPEITLHHLSENLGCSAARNLGLDVATGDLIFFFDDDDLVAPTLFETALHHFCQHPDSDALVVSYQNLIHHAELDSPYFPTSLFDYRTKGPELERNAFRVFLRSCPPIHSVVIRRQAIGDLRFVEHLEVGEDWLFWLQLARQNCQFAYCPQPLVYYRRHAGSKSHHQRYFFSELEQFLTYLQTTSNLLESRHDRFFIESKLFFTCWSLRNPRFFWKGLRILMYPEWIVHYSLWLIATWMRRLTHGK